MSVSVKDVAALAGVSVGTVSNVLNRPDKVAPGTVERVQSAIAELGFVRNDSARQLRAGRSSTVGLIVLAMVIAAWWFYPIWTGEAIPYDSWRMRMWFSTWI